MEDPDYKQMCVVRGVIESPEQIAELVSQRVGDGTVRIKPGDEWLTLPTPGEPDTGGRHDVSIFVHNDDIGKFAIPRLQFGISWWEDYLDNSGKIVPEHIKTQFPRTW